MTGEAAKRATDFFLSAAGLAALAPVFAFIAAAIKLDSPGPVFFRQVRVGRGGRPFRIFKFRTMRRDAPALGGFITRADDPRITGVGAFLRRRKLDELPQLINVLKGDMSLVGPRPEVPKFANVIPGQERVYDVRPGITDPASIEYRSEGDLLGGSPAPEAHYVREILPRKVEIYLQYIEERSLAGDALILARTVASLLFPAASAPGSRGFPR